jgi:hypothetical protein
MKGDSKMRHPFAGIITASVILLLTLALACNQNSGTQLNDNRGGQSTYTDAQTAATQSLATFRKLVTRENYKELGFESPEEASSATLGQPIRVMTVTLEQLKGYQPQGDPSRLLTDLTQTQYPVAVRDQVRSSITVEQVNGKWRASSFGEGSLAKQVDQLRKRASASTSEAQAGEMLVHVLPFHLYFMGHRTGDRLTLTPVTDYPAYRLKGGGDLPAEEVFSTLRQFAQKYNGLPL